MKGEGLDLQIHDEMNGWIAEILPQNPWPTKDGALKQEQEDKCHKGVSWDRVAK